MLEAVSFIGRIVKQETDLVEGLVQDVAIVPGFPKYLVTLNFQLQSGQKHLTWDMVEIPEEENARRSFLAQWRWVGNASGNNPQLFLTTTNPEYLLGGVRRNKLAPLALLEELENREERGGLYQKLLAIKDNFFREDSGSYLLDVSGLDWKDMKEKPRTVAEAIHGILKHLGLTRKKVALWTLLFNDEPLVREKPYDEVVLSYMQRSFEGEGLLDGVCSVCDKEGTRVAFSAFKRLSFLKYYITDKLGAASHLAEEGFSKNFLICQSCFQDMMVAEKFIRNNLSLRVGDLNFLVLPFFLVVPEEANAQELYLWVERLKTKVAGLVSTASWLENIAGSRKSLEEELQNFLEELPYENQAIMSFLFYRKSQGELRVFALIKDVSPSRVRHLLLRSHFLATKAEKLLGLKSCWLDLTRIYRLIPLSSGDQTEQKKILYIYEGLLKRYPINYTFLVKQFLLLAKAYLLEKYEGTSIMRPPDKRKEHTLAERMVEAGFFLKLLREENLLRGLRNLQDTDFHGFGLDELDLRMQEYLREMHYSKPEIALFLLGYLLNEVGKGQYLSGHRDKPILEKLNYQGMPWSKVRQLANVLFEKLRQYDRLRFTERLYATMKALLDSYRDNWPLGPEENTFYILSGYSYGVLTSTQVGKKETEGEEDA